MLASQILPVGLIKWFDSIGEAHLFPAQAAPPGA